MSLTVSILQGGTNSFETTSEMANFPVTDFIFPGCKGNLTNTSGVAPSTGSFAVNAQGTPDATVAVSAGSAYVTGTPTSGNSQVFRVKNSASSNVTISSNTTGGTRYDWIYIKLDPDKLKDPAADASDVATLVTSRSTSASTDNGTPPTYGLNIAVVTVANGFSTISNSNITDKRVQSGFRNDNASSEVNAISFASAATGNAPAMSATGTDTNINLNLASKGTGEIQLNGTGISGAYNTFTPSPTGYSGTPTVNTARYKQVGKIVHMDIDFSGTSNATTMTFGLPVAAKSAGLYLGRATDSGAAQSNPALLAFSAGGTSVTVYKTLGAAAWTGSGTKGINAYGIIYEAN